MIRSYILKTLLERIESIYDKEYQQRVWIEGEVQNVMILMKLLIVSWMTGMSILKNFKDFGITDNQYLLLKIFSKSLEAFSDENDWPQEFIDTPEWTKITEMAKEVLKAFHWKMPDQSC